MPLGAVAGFKGGKWDFVISRMIEIGTGLPTLIFALLLLTILGTGVLNVILVLSILSWIGPARITRGSILPCDPRPGVCHGSQGRWGPPTPRYCTATIFPNAFSPLLIAFSFSVPGFIFAEAGLSFLGLGITEPTASWGKLVGGSVGTTVTVFWHLALLPTIMIALTMLGFSFVGDGMQEALDVTRSENIKGKQCVSHTFVHSLR